MDFRGQAFDVFKLLIAAVVAGAILLIMLNVLKIIPGIGTQQPSQVAAEHVKSKLNDIGNPVLVPNVTFNPGDSLNTKTISIQAGGISEDQLCVVTSESTPNVGAFKELPDSGTPKSIVKYTGTTPQRTRLFVLCDRERDIDETIATYGYGTGSELGIKSNNCLQGSSPKTQTFCIVSVVSET